MTIIKLEDLSDRLLRPFSGMTDGQLRRGEGFRRDNPRGLFIGESARVVERALDAGVKPIAALVEERWLAHDRALLDRIERSWPDCKVFLSTVPQFREITGYEVVRGSLVCFERPEPATVEEVIADARRIAILEDVTNYTNMGSVFRSAAALGMDAVLITPSCHDPYYRRCARVSMGTVFQVPWARIPSERTDLGSLSGDSASSSVSDRAPDTGDWASWMVPQLRGRGFVTVAMALRGQSLDLRDPRLSQAEKLAVVLGTEGDGLRDSTIDACDYTVRIPMFHDVDSLNVSVAAGIAFWELA